MLVEKKKWQRYTIGSFKTEKYKLELTNQNGVKIELRPINSEILDVSTTPLLGYNPCFPALGVTEVFQLQHYLTR